MNKLRLPISVRAQCESRFSEEWSASATQALAQIEKRQYHAALSQKGYQHVLKIGIGFCGKDCVLRSVGTV